MIRLICIFLASISFGLVSAQNQIVVTPDTIDDILYNPGIGVEIFDQNNQPANYPPGRLFYTRYNWIEIEQEKGVIDYQKIDDMLALARSKGQRVGLRIMAINDYGCETCVPQYVVDAAGGNMVCSGADGAPFKKVFWPNYNDAFMDAVEDLMIALGTRYDGHPDLNHIDLGFFGCWGEFNNSCVCESDRYKAKLWSYETNMHNTDIHFATFPNTPIISMGNNAYSMGKGSGWRADCFGDWGNGEWSHMTHIYPDWADNCDDCWEKGMVSFEVCWNCQEQYRRGYDFAETMAKGLEWHMSSMNAKSSPIPTEWQPILDEALKKMGYRLRISQLEHPENISYAEPMQVSMEWSNDGVAPPYHEYILRLELSPVDGGQDFKYDFDVDVRDWLPGTFNVEGDFTIPSPLNGLYNMRFALLFPDTKEPAIELANVGKDSLGWYPLSQVNVLDPFSFTSSVTEGSGSISPENRMFTPGSEVSITAIADLGFAFASWGGDLSGNDNPAKLIIDDNKSVTASFIAGPTFSLTTSVEGLGSVSPESGTYNGGTVVSITAIPDSGYIFASWSRDLSGTNNPQDIIMDNDKTLTANFIRDNVGIAEKHKELVLVQNYPNPFSTETTFEYTIPSKSKVQLRVFNTYGQIVAVLLNQYQSANTYKIIWDGTDASGNKLANGIYIYQMIIGSELRTMKIIIEK